MVHDGLNHATIKEQDLNAVAEFAEALRAEPKLRFLFFELTDACNLCCLHCGSSASPDRNTFLPFEGIRKVLDRVAEAYAPGKIMICLSGGEPMLHPDFFRIIEYSKRLGFLCGVTTNGTLITPAAAEQLCRSGIDSVTFSLDGLKESHNYLRNRPWAYDKTIAGIQNLVKANDGRITTQVTTVIHRKNFSQLDALYDLMVSLHLDSWRVINMEPMGRALENQDILLDRAQLRSLMDFIEEKRFDPKTPIEVTYGCAHYLGLDYEHMVRDAYFLCGSGTFVASVLCNGDIYSCLDIERRPELVQGNIAHDDFVDVWENRFQAFRQDRSLLSRKCQDCEHRKFCRGDSAHTWNFDRNEPTYCMKLWKEENSHERRQ